MSKEKSKKEEADKSKDKKQPTPDYRQDFIIPNNLFWWRN